MSPLRLAICLLTLLSHVAGAAELCLGPSSNGVNATYMCPDQTENENNWIGYSAFGQPCSMNSPYCHAGDPPPPTLAPRWTISASAIDPHDNEGPLPSGSNDLYLWMNCSGWTEDEGSAFGAEFALVGDLAVVDFQPQNAAIVNTGTITDLRLEFFGCPAGPWLIGVITVDTPVSVESVASTSWGRVKAVYR